MESFIAHDNEGDHTVVNDDNKDDVDDVDDID